MSERVGTSATRVALVAIVAALCAAGEAAAAEPCPTEVQFDGAASSWDLGWTGIAHGRDLGALRVRMGVAGCAGTVQGSCGPCVLSGPLPIAGGGNHRCAADVSLRCSADAECGSSGPCRFFVSPPAPLDAGGLPLCVLAALTGPISGTVNPDTGSMSATLPLRVALHDGPDMGIPCPRCVGGFCDGGARSGSACQVDASSPSFGDTSFDCPPGDPVTTPVLDSAVTLTTGMQAVALTADSPDCRAPGSVGQKCFCDSCDDAAGTPCVSHAECVAVGATRCGGKRCVGGPANGTPCVATSQCAGGICGVPGQTRPSSCTIADGCQPGTASEGECAEGPVDQFCAPPESHLGCTVVTQASDCPLTGLCSEARLRPCYLDNGVVGGSVVVAGAASAPVDGVATATLGALSCGRLTGGNSALTNPSLGLPGLVRLRLPGSSTFRAAICPEAPASCRAPAVAHAARLTLRDDARDTRDRIVWRWHAGATTLKADYGTPLADDAYGLCLYDAGVLLASARIDGGAVCAGKPCWRENRRGFRFADRAAAHAGVAALVLREGSSDGKAEIDFTGKGAALAMPDVSRITGPIDVRLHHRDGAVCWGATYHGPFDALDAARGVLKARSD